MVGNFQVYHATLNEFQAFTTDFSSMTKHGNNVKVNLSLHNTKVVLSLALYVTGFGKTRHLCTKINI